MLQHDEESKKFGDDVPNPNRKCGFFHPEGHKKAGERCGKERQDDSIYCWLHDPRPEIAERRRAARSKRNRPLRTMKDALKQYTAIFFDLRDGRITEEQSSQQKKVLDGFIRTLEKEVFVRKMNRPDVVKKLSRAIYREQEKLRGRSE